MLTDVNYLPIARPVPSVPDLPAIDEPDRDWQTAPDGRYVIADADARTHVAAATAYAFWRISAQPLATVARPPPDRAARRRAARASIAHDTRVVMLRRTSPAAPRGDGEAKWHYRVRFVVRGHWRHLTDRHGQPYRIWIHQHIIRTTSEPHTKLDAAIEDDQAFWVWAAIEVLRRTGARIEELLELTHLSLRQYHAPTGEMVPLLQISPSKTDHERVIPADPELVAVLARIIRRIKATDGKVPLLTRYDFHERAFGPPLPHLFQRLSLNRLAVISPTYVNQLMKKLALRAGITDVDGSPISFSPHDFRRIFSTETVNSGLPIHIAAKLLGHLDLNTTQGSSFRRSARPTASPCLRRPPKTCSPTASGTWPPPCACGRTPSCGPTCPPSTRPAWWRRSSSPARQENGSLPTRHPPSWISPAGDASSPPSGRPCAASASTTTGSPPARRTSGKRSVSSTPPVTASPCSARPWGDTDISAGRVSVLLSDEAVVHARRALAQTVLNLTTGAWSFGHEAAVDTGVAERMAADLALLPPG